MAPKTAWDCPRSSYPQRLSRVQDTIAPVEVQRQRVPHRNIASLQSLAWWNAPWCHTLRKFQLFRFTHPFTPLVKNRRWWKRQQKKGAKLIATVPSLTKVQAMDSLQSGSFETYLNYIDDTVSHIRSQTFRFLVGVIGEEPHWPSEVIKIDWTKIFAGDCGSEKHPPFFRGPQQNVQKPKSQLFIISPISVHHWDFFWWKGWSWVFLSWKCFFYMTICSHV